MGEARGKLDLYSPQTSPEICPKLQDSLSSQVVVAIICHVSETLMVYLDHIQISRFNVKAFKGILTIASYIYSVPRVQCCSTLHQAVTLQAQDKIHLKGVLIVFMTQCMFKFNVFRMN